MPIRTMRNLLLTALAVLWPLWQAHASTPWPDAGGPFWLASDRPYFEPILAEPRSAMTKALFPANSSAMRYMVKPGRRLVWDLSVGSEFPLLGVQSLSDHVGWLPPGHFGVGLWLPIAFHMIEDFEDDSAPIIDTDYKFGGMIKAQWAPPVTLGLDAAVLGAQLHIGHESTHIGDEFTIHAREQYGDSFRRVNVSYQFVDVAVELGLRSLEHQLRVHLGRMQVAFTSEDSWYQTTPVDVTTAPATASRRNSEWYAGAEWEYLRFALRPFVSVDARLRPVFDYDRPSRDVAEEWGPSLNAMVGVRPPETYQVTDVYLRFYRGVNPAGQFRDQDDYVLWGLGLAFRR